MNKTEADFSLILCNTICDQWNENASLCTYFLFIVASKIEK